jgi:hypothetical protein
MSTNSAWSRSSSIGKEPWTAPTSAVGSGPKFVNFRR